MQSILTACVLLELIQFGVKTARAACVNVGCEFDAYGSMDYPDYSSQKQFEADEGTKLMIGGHFDECESVGAYTNYKTYPPEEDLSANHGITFVKSTLSNTDNNFSVTWPTTAPAGKTLYTDRIALLVYQETSSSVIMATYLTVLNLNPDGTIDGACGSPGAPTCTSDTDLENSLCSEHFDVGLPTQDDIVHEL